MASNDCLICLEPCTPSHWKDHTPCCRKVFHHRCLNLFIMKCSICHERVNVSLGCFYRSKCCESVFHWSCKLDEQRNLPFNNRCPVCECLRFGEEKLVVNIDEE